MTASMPLSTPPALRFAVAFAFASMVSSLVQSFMLLLTRALFTANKGDEAWRTEGEDFSSVVVIGVIVSTVVAILLALSAVLTMTMSSQLGRVLLFVAAGIAIVWNLGCGCMLSFAWMTGIDEQNRNAGAENYVTWQFSFAVVMGFIAGIAAVVAIVLLAQRSVNQYFRALRSPGY